MDLPWQAGRVQGISEHSKGKRPWPWPGAASWGLRPGLKSQFKPPEAAGQGPLRPRRPQRPLQRPLSRSIPRPVLTAAP